MKSIENVSVIGLGAIGAAYAARLHDMDPSCVKIIADVERIHRYQEEGVSVNGKRYEFRYIAPDADTEPADLILVAVKYDGLAQAIESMKRHVGPDTVIMSLMNGISSENIIASEFGGDNMLYAMCVAIDAVRDGANVQFSSIGRICFGEKRNEMYSPNVQRVRALFERANIPYEIPANMERSMWWKFMINVGVNQASAVLRAPYGVFQENQEAHDVMTSAMREVVAVSQRVGVHLDASDVEAFHPILHALAPDGKTSMLQDIEAGRKTEVEYFAGTVCELGRAYGISTPVNEMLLKMIHVLEQNKG